MSIRLFRRGDVWYMRGSVAGRRLYESTRTADRAQAEAVAEATERALWERRLHGPAAALTVAEAVETYLEAGGEHRFLLPILDAWHDRRVAEIKPGMVRDLARRLYPDAKPATLNRQVIAPLVAVINCAAERGLAQPLKVKRFKIEETLRRAVDRAWIDAFRTAARPYCRALALFMFTSGARVGEAVAMTPRDLDFEARTALARDTKAGNDHRYRLTTEVVVELANLPPRGGRVFGYASRQSVYGPWRTACRRAGIEHVPPHQAGRHSFATEMIVEAGVDVATVGRLGNWASRRLLLDTYVHPKGDAEIVEAHFGRKAKGGK